VEVKNFRSIENFPAEKQHLAIVIDEFGGTEGLLPLKIFWKNCRRNSG
jgi:Mg2+/Co2+ transporter CorC